MKQLITLSLIFFTAVTFSQNTYIHCGKLIDAQNGRVLTEKTIVVSGNTITAVQDGFTNPTNTSEKFIDLKTKTVMPGWIDMHYI